MDDPGTAVSVPDFASARIAPPPGVNPDGCWVRDVAPAELETVTRQIEVAPARYDAAGRKISPARFRTETAQVITRERQELIFETPCPDALTPLWRSRRPLPSARGISWPSMRGRCPATVDRWLRCC